MKSTGTTYWDFHSIEDSLGMERTNFAPYSDLNPWAWEYNPPDGKHTRNYWARLTPEEREEKLKTHGMRGNNHTEEARERIRQAHLGRKRTNLHKGGTLQKDGKIVSFTCLSHFCKEHKLSSGHLCELLQGKRKSVKGWTNVL